MEVWKVVVVLVLGIFAQGANRAEYEHDDKNEGQQSNDIQVEKWYLVA